MRLLRAGARRRLFAQVDCRLEMRPTGPVSSADRCSRGRRITHRAASADNIRFARHPGARARRSTHHSMRKQTDATHQGDIAWIGTKGIKSRIDTEGKQVIVSVLKSLIEPQEGFFLLPYARIGPGDPNEAVGGFNVDCQLLPIPSFSGSGKGLPQSGCRLGHFAGIVTVQQPRLLKFGDRFVIATQLPVYLEQPPASYRKVGVDVNRLLALFQSLLVLARIVENVNRTLV